MSFQLNIANARVTKIEHLAEHVEQVTFHSNAAVVLMDVHTRGYPIAIDDTRALYVRIGGSSDDVISNVDYDYHATGIVYAVDASARTLEASFGGLLMQLEFASARMPTQIECEAWPNKTICVFLASAP
jgi:hypothetical protein